MVFIIDTNVTPYLYTTSDSIIYIHENDDTWMLKLLIVIANLNTSSYSIRWNSYNRLPSCAWFPSSKCERDNMSQKCHPFCILSNMLDSWSERKQGGYEMNVCTAG